MRKWFASQWMSADCSLLTSVTMRTKTRVTTGVVESHTHILYCFLFQAVVFIELKAFLYQELLSLHLYSCGFHTWNCNVQLCYLSLTTIRSFSSTFSSCNSHNRRLRHVKQIVHQPALLKIFHLQIYLLLQPFIKHRFA